MNGHDEAAEGALLAYLSEDDREYLLGQGVRRRFRANDFVLMEGDPSDHVHVLVSGWVRVSTVVEDGREVLFGLRGPGEVLGDLAAINGWARTASCRAIEPCVAFQLTGAQFLAVLRARPGVPSRGRWPCCGSGGSSRPAVAGSSSASCASWRPSPVLSQTAHKARDNRHLTDAATRRFWNQAGIHFRCLRPDFIFERGRE